MKIVFFAPYPALRPVIEQVFRDRPDRDEINYQIYQDFFQNSFEYIDADVVIARGFSAHSLQKRGVLFAELKVSGYDVIEAVRRCQELARPKKIGLVGAFNMMYGSEAVAPVFPEISFQTYTSDDESKLESIVRRALKDGCDAIVGGYSSSLLAKKFGVPSVIVNSGKDSVNAAIEDAKARYALYITEKGKSTEIANIMNYSFQGIISADNNGIITLANTNCYSILNFQGGSLLGHSVLEFFPQLSLKLVTEGGKKILSDLIDRDNRKLTLNCVPVVLKSGITGCVLTFQDITQVQAEEERIRRKLHRSGFRARYRFTDILHTSRIMDDAIADAVEFSYSDSNVLINGETGTGKELFAQSIHNSGARRHQPFVAINCAALPEDLLESELFGYVEGAFTGASRSGKAGFFERAHKGTIFLDEIEDISPKLQSRLLRVLQEREIIRLGSDTVIPIDVRVITASNRDLKEEVKKGNFRRDLLYRLDVLELNLPPLRRRPEDIVLLLNHYISLRHTQKACLLQEISPEALDLLCAYEWPGNVRELRNFCERLSIMCRKETAVIADVLHSLPELEEVLPAKKALGPCTGTSDHVSGKPAAVSDSRPDPAESSPDSRGDGTAALTAPAGTKAEEPLILYDEQHEILKALAKHRNSKKKAAAELGINPSTLWRKMKRYGL